MCVQLHVVSCYSLLQSSMSINKIIQSCIELGYDSVALCDMNVMHGAPDFYQKAIKNNIKPLFALQVKVKVDKYIVNLLLYAKNDLGYKALLKISTYVNTIEQILEIDDLCAYSANLIIVLYSVDCVIEELLSREHYDELKLLLIQIQKRFSKFYGGICNNDNGLLKIRNIPYKRLLHSLKIKTVAISSIYYQYKEDELTYQCLCAMRKETTIDDKKMNVSLNRYFYSKELMKQYYDEDDLANTIQIKNECNVLWQLEKASLPIYKNKYQMSSKDFLIQLCHAGLKKRFMNQSIDLVYYNRLKYELDVIVKMHFEDYFLIVYDYVRFAKNKGIYVGCGRGSAAGSLVAYCLGITNVDPIKYDLLFERFLNPERISMPDIDVDFPDNRRDEVISYVKERYGDYKVAHILTFNTLGAKAVLRDVGRVLKINSRQIDVLCKLIGNKPKTTLKDTYQNEGNFRKMIDGNRELKRLFMIALQLEGLPRHYSLHAAGIILAKNVISEVCPLMKLDDQSVVSQYTMEHLEALGLIKFDFLGLRNLTIIDEILTNLEKDNIHLDLNKLTLDDKKTYQLLQNVDTLGVFQLESDGIQALISKMQPKEFEDIVATIALFRPGPMENIPEYLQRRANPALIDCIHPDLTNILHKTYGIMIYQEQILQIAQKMAGFTLGKADILRKAISKKNEQELLKLQSDFVSGSINKGYALALAQKVFNLILKFANYGFNRSHSVAYAMIAYQMAYLKANAPLYFYCALLNSVIGSEIKTSEYLFEIRKRGIKILPPSVNYATSKYKIENNALRFPLSVIKGIKQNITNQIIEERKRGQFIDFYECIARLSALKIGKNHLEALINAGAMDEYRINRATMINNLDEVIKYGDMILIYDDNNQLTINTQLTHKQPLKMVSENIILRSQKEKDVLGFYLSIHPIAKIREQYQINICLQQLPRYVNQRVCFIGQINKIKQHRTKNGALMAFVEVSDDSAKFDLVIMPNIYEIYRNELIIHDYILVEGKIDKETSCLVQRLKRIHS